MTKITFVYAILSAVAICACSESQHSDGSPETQKGKFLFTIVTFSNLACQSSATTASLSRNGTCFSRIECQNKGGMAMGGCALGFGVCCVFLVTASGDITQNATYIRNPGFPSPYADTEPLTYTVRKSSSDVCAIRLDFDSFTTLGPARTDELDGGACQDPFSVVTSSGAQLPVVCGLSSGQHMYAELGESPSDTATLTFAFRRVATTQRLWEVKVTQIECSNPMRPPNGCLQYHTSLSGRFSTFNFLSTTTSHLANQNYPVCIRQEEGYCCIEYSVCPDPRSFSLTGLELQVPFPAELCIQDLIYIPGSYPCPGGSYGNLLSRYCGSSLGVFTGLTTPDVPVCDCTSPFQVIIVTDNFLDVLIAGAVSTNRGLCLQFRQLSC